ncbi:sarcosine oxidase [Lophiostoma macrostomum CBS 122681]|uniref:Sarcosine oxidase n=1 Tax=Lophiostoma macrostomum CBS 122681 TaxID=1314788 RepID=A0A6A6SRC9_9PLEO|nr:sarcosine oxidase [Lophiostoma macrostomum CBS 122681]
MAPTHTALPNGLGTSFLIVGAGTIGLSTALHLTKRGYKDITLLDRGDSIPSAYSAGNDENKIVRADYEDPFYATKALEAIDAWSHDPIFIPHYKQCGYLVTSSGAAPDKAKSHVDRLIRSISSHPAQPKGCLTTLATPTEIRKHSPRLTGPLSGWSGYINSHAGYARAAPAMKGLYTELVARGVKFHFGTAGDAIAILPDAETAKLYPAPRPYVKTADGNVQCADVIILATGAHTARLLPQAGAQLTAKAWAVGHVRLSATEAKTLLHIPVVNCRDLGFFFAPVPVREDEPNGDWLIKLCAHGGGYTNRSMTSGGGTSLPPTQSEENDAIPVEDEALIRQLLRETLPEFARRPLERKFICWCADTADSEYVIDNVPSYAGLVLASGDSAHAFKMLPVFGQWVADMIESGSQGEVRWRWKTQDSDGTEDINWRVGNVRDIKDVERRSDETEKLVSKL